jgi:DNA-binding ferritin-like protein
MTTQRISELFAKDVTRDIPPVVYMHEQTPAKIADEVSEYVVTGGYPEDDPRHKRVPNGIHEQFVRLLRAISSELGKPRGSDLPAAWISGFFGSGKSVFAKMLGLALDGRELPDGVPLHEALLARDTSPLAAELREAWRELAAALDGESIGVVFDIGGVARDNEHIHAAIVRQIQARLGYCVVEPAVADYELRLELDGEYDRFLEVCERELGEPWAEIKDRALAEDEFSEVMHHMNPERFREPDTWLIARAGRQTQDLSANEAVTRVGQMLEHRAPGKALFVVIDEVSQYIHQDTDRMLKLQSFVSSLGQQLGTQVWLLVTGQEKLEEQSESTTLGKLKDRFPPKLRVHLSATNIRDVVHKRLLEKAPDKKPELAALFQRCRPNIQLYAYGGRDIGEGDFLDTYPMLPGYIDLILEITTALRTRSTRRQGDDHAIRGLIQMLGELFRAQGIAADPVGRLIALDDIYEVQATGLDSDTQATMARIQAECAKVDGELGDQMLRAAKAVALLELIQEQKPTTAEFVACCLYRDMTQGSNLGEVAGALEELRGRGLLQYSEKRGYKIQSSAGQEWEREREALNVTSARRSELVQSALKDALGKLERPRMSGMSFQWAVNYVDDILMGEVRLLDPRSDTTVPVDLHVVPPGTKSPAEWTRQSGERKDRIFWVSGAIKDAFDAAARLGKSQQMVQRYKPRRESLPHDRRRLLLDEEARMEELRGRLTGAIEASLFAGKAYVRGREVDPSGRGASFATVLHDVGEQYLPEFYPYFENIVVTESELAQLWSKDLSGLSPKFLSDEIGIIAVDEGHFVARCEGAIPQRVFDHVEDRGRVVGAQLFAHFAGQPFGYSNSLVRACLLGLLRASKIEIHPESGQTLSSFADSGVQDLFRKDKDQKRADYMPASGDEEVSLRDYARMAKFFERHCGMENVSREPEAIADAVYERFPALGKRASEVIGLYARAIGPRAAEPTLLGNLREAERALDQCRSSRQVKETVKKLLKYMDTLQDHVPKIASLGRELDDEVVATMERLRGALRVEYAQLEEADLGGGEAAEHAGAIRAQLDTGETPWRGAGEVLPHADALAAIYERERERLIGQQLEYVAAARKELHLREGFETLDKKQSNHVLLPLGKAVAPTEAAARSPHLATLKDAYVPRVDAGRDEAHRRFDEILAEAEVIVEQLEVSLDNKVIASVAELDALLDGIRARALVMLEDGSQVRFKT